MATNSRIFDTAVTINAAQDYLWAILTSPERVAAITGLELSGHLGADEGGILTGSALLAGQHFAAKARPHDIELIGRELKLGVRITPQGSACRVYMVAVCTTEEDKLRVSHRVVTVLESIKQYAERPRSVAPGQDPASRRLPYAPEETIAAKTFHSEERRRVSLSADDFGSQAEIGGSLGDRIRETMSQKRAELESANQPEYMAEAPNAQPDYSERSALEVEFAPRAVEPAPQAVKPPVFRVERAAAQVPLEPAPLVRESSDRRRERRPVKAKAVIILAAVLLAVAGILFGIRYLGRLRGIVGESSDDLSARVTLAAADSLELGSQRSQIAWTLGTNGVELEGLTVYRSEQALGSGIPSEQIGVVYSADDRAERIIYKNMAASTTIGDVVFAEGASVSADMTLADIESTTGCKLSMFVRYLDEEQHSITEVHFGYLDPFANFDDAWRGSYVFIIDSTDGQCQSRYWQSYDGSDPLMVSALEGTPLANQYDDYSDFLNDRYSYEYALLLMNGYSKGDIKQVFHCSLDEYYTYGGTHFYTLVDDYGVERLDDGQPGEDGQPTEGTPVYNITVGLDSAGGFRMANYSNMRLFNKSGMLADSDYRLITRGMSYNEVREIMGLLPTAFFYDGDYFTVCYGRYLDTDVAEEQFELIVKFDVQNNYAQKVLINTAVAAAGETLPEEQSGEAAGSSASD